MPTFERLPRFDREFRRMPQELRHAFLAMLPMFIAALRDKPPSLPPALRVKRVKGRSRYQGDHICPDGRATFEYSSEVIAGEIHIIWRRVGDHGVLREP